MPRPVPLKKLHNRLWISRKRRSLGQKQVAALLELDSPSEVSRYESGTRLPPFDKAVRLSLLYGKPLPYLFAGVYEREQQDVSERLNRSPLLQQKVGSLAIPEYCSYGDQLERPVIEAHDKSQARRHVTALRKQLAYL